MHTLTFVPAEYQSTTPMLLQPVMLGSMPSFSQASGLQRIPILTNVRPAGNSMAQGLVAASTAGQQMLN